MILNNAPQNEAIMSNVGEIGEFRIRNSAKAFNILSSGLYANKIRAVIRELSCNAVDSHVAAGKADVPFEVHLPNALDPHFSVRDFGTGLTHEQVTSIYTTYFESTKTDSNAFIGALGLGSKSPFSYTDNFTVTAIKDGKRGIYSAFINGEGVPSIALMMTEDTDEANGVEIKFSVNERYDFYKFKEEAASVYRHFKLQPTVTGSSEFRVEKSTYETRDIIPGVHTTSDGRNSVAVMGNIAYPINIPNAESTLGDLRHMLNCGLEMHFDIGELDFQASREGLSYIPETIASIKRKLEAVRDQLSVHIKTEADKIDNLWMRAEFLAKKHKSALWAQAVDKYATDTKLPTYETSAYGRLATMLMRVEDLAKNHNMVIRGTSRARGSRTMTNLKPSKDWDRSAANVNYFECWHFTVDEDMHFVINDTKVGVLERAKHHYRDVEQTVYNRNIMVIEAADKTKAVDTAGFFAALHNPPESNIFKASSLNEKPRKDSGLGKNVSILCLTERKRGHWGNTDLVWTDAGKINSFDATKTYYYVPLSGFQMQSKFGVTDAKELRSWLRSCGITALAHIEIYGVRKGDMEDISNRTNWVNLETHIAASLQVPDQKLIKGIVRNKLTDRSNMMYNSTIVGNIADQNSPYVALISEFKGVEKVTFNDYAFRSLYRYYAASMNFNPETEVTKYEVQFETLSQRYPLLQHIYGATETEIAAYINLIDNSL
jgi:hypothetical protein